jgi:hypothetical protein
MTRAPYAFVYSATPVVSGINACLRDVAAKLALGIRRHSKGN